MGKPDDLEKYRELTVNDLTFYVAKEIMNGLEEQTQELKFVVEGYGWFKLPIPGVSKDSGGNDEKNC
jgi:hypothetical protein